MTVTVTVVIGPEGVQPTDPLVLRTEAVAEAVSIDPGLTTELPGSLIEDLASTNTGALVVMDTAKVDLINSVNPRTANEALLIQLGAIYGVPQGVDVNGSVYVQFTGPVGFLIPQGFMVGDGTNQYVVQDGGIIPAGGVSVGLYCVAQQAGTFAIPANTVTHVLTSVPTGYTVTCNNPTAGLPATTTQTIEDYRAQVLQSGQAPAQGFTTRLKAMLQAVPGVQARLISTQLVNGSWQIVVGGGDPYEVANAIFLGTFGINNLSPSTLYVTGITNANPGVMTTNQVHGFTSGKVINVTGVLGMAGINNVPLTITVLAPKSFSIGINTTSSGAYSSGGVVTPNLRNVPITINDYPDSYTIPIVVPLQQQVAITLLWNSLPNPQGATSFVSPASVSALATPAIVDYINTIVTGQPINIFELQTVFQQAVVSILPTPLISRMAISVDIDGVTVPPDAGTGIIPGDSQSYFFTTAGAVVVQQG